VLRLSELDREEYDIEETIEKLEANTAMPYEATGPLLSRAVERLREVRGEMQDLKRKLA
jgi:hypothetical protein